MGRYSDVINTVKDLKEDFPKLTDFEALQIAVKMSQNDVIARAFCVTTTNDHPVALEAVAMALGHIN